MRGGAGRHRGACPGATAGRSSHDLTWRHRGRDRHRPRASARTGEFASVPLERTNVTHLKHLNGTISMARGGPDTATSGIFIADQPELDFGGKRNPDGQGFAAFGQVTSGMDVVRRIQQSPAQGQTLTPAITIVSIERLR